MTDFSVNTGATRAATFPTRTDFTAALKPLLDRFGSSRDFSLILFHAR